MTVTQGVYLVGHNGPVQQVESLADKARGEIAGATSTSELKEIERQYLGKQGELTGLMRQVGKLEPEERPKLGQAVNQAKAELTKVIEARHAELLKSERAAQFEEERIDVTLPGHRPRAGRPHVLAETRRRIIEVLGGLGFQYYDGPELEQFRYNFDALNYPPNHPAMDDQDTFYVTDDLLLRTQGTAIQGRVFESEKPPLRRFTVGRTFRNEAVDRTHSHTFHQVDAFMIDKGVSMAHLKGTLKLFATAMFGDDVKVRFRPDFFPFVEPGVDYAISTPKLFDGKWVELGGAGMIHPNILEAYGMDPKEWSGFAFGLGVERIPMMRHGIDDLRLLLENDFRFLRQFA